jgi:ketosteroid isomerase-like protein
MRKLFWIVPMAAGIVLAATNAAAEKEILGVMETYKDAMIHNNAAVLEKLLHEDLTFVHSAGQLERKADVMKSVTTGKNVIIRMEFSDSTVRTYGNTALVRCRVDLWHSETNIVHMNVLHAWVKTADGWQLAARQATRLSQ